MSRVLNHPRGLLICFGTELWERFSYYGMRALLIYYLTQHFLFSDEKSYAIYGAYTALAWGLPVIGGILADRYLGSRKAVTLGALLLAAGHLLMAVEGPAAMEVVVDGAATVERDPAYLNLFFVSLALIVTGVGFLKTNISTVVGALYEHDDPRREAGFTIFYLGINIGAAVAPLLCGWLGQAYGWKYGFGLAGIGMLSGLLLFLWGQKFLEGHAEPPEPGKLRQPVFIGLNREWLNYLGAAVLVLMAWLLLQHHDFVGTALGVFGALLGIAILYFSFARCTPTERDRMLVVAVLIAFSILFWSFYEQMGSSLNLFSDRLVDRRVFGWEVQASQLQALPAIYVILFAPLFSLMWTALGARQLNPNIPVKFAIGLVLVGLAFFMPVIGAWTAGPGEKIGLFWFAMVFFLMVCGEMCMAPIAMNMITRLCPKRVVGMMMGTYFLSLSIGSFVAGQLARLTSVARGAERADVAGTLATYTSSFVLFGYIAVATGVVLYLLSPLLYARMHEKNEQHGTSLIARVYGRLLPSAGGR
jgi:proton-dependent oligopeptide transporter, POT family